MSNICLVCGGKMKHVSGRDWVCTACGADAWMGDYGSLCFDAELFDDDDGIGYDGMTLICAYYGISVILTYRWVCCIIIITENLNLRFDKSN